MATPTSGGRGSSTRNLEIIDRAQYRILRRFWPDEPTFMDVNAYAGKSKLRSQLGEEVVQALAKCESVLDFGCGIGDEAIELAKIGCRRVIGLDIQEERLEQGRASARAAGVSVEFASSTNEQVDAVVSLDAFEHFGDPAGILKIMYKLLKPGGRVYTAFGPTWYHPLGGHLVSVFPWAHLLFSEASLIAWRSHIRDDGATCFAETLGGLNQMTIRRFEKLVSDSPLEIVRLECIPIRKLAPLHNRITREWTSAFVRAELRRP